MLEKPGDLIPVVAKATAIRWTSRRSQILNFLHRGPVTFSTLVYDTNVGDISPLSAYFNPDRISERELNTRFGVYPTNGEKHASPKKEDDDSQVKPRILLYPENKPNIPQPQTQFKTQRIMNWVLSQETDRNSSGESGKSTPEPDHLGWPKPDTSMPPPKRVTSKPYTMPVNSINFMLDSVWANNGDSGDSDSWPLGGWRRSDGLSTSSLGLGGLATKFQELRSSSGESQELFGVWGDQGISKKSYEEPRSSSGESQELFGLWGDLGPSKRSFEEPRSSSEETRDMFDVWCEQQLNKGSSEEPRSSSEESQEMFGAVGDKAPAKRGL